MSRVIDAARAIARLELSGQPDDGADLQGMSGADQIAVIDQLSANRVLGLGVRAYEAGLLELSEDASAELVARHDAAMSQTIRVELMMLRVAELLEASGIVYRILKGSALAHLYASNPADRGFRDVDILVRAEDISSAVAALSAAGAIRPQPELRPGFDERFGKSVTMRLEGVEVDLHRVLAPGPFGVWMFPGDLFILPSEFTVAGRTLPTLDRTDHLVHACYHVALGQAVPAMTNLRDIALLAAGDWDAGRFHETISRWKGRAAIARANSLLETILGVTPHPELQQQRPMRDDADLLSAYTQQGERFPALATATFKALPAADRLAYAMAVGLPEGSSTTQRAREVLRQRAWRH